MYDFKGKTAIVTGAANGIGKATALRLAKEGCNVSIFDLDQKLLDRTTNELIDAGVKAASYIVDVSDAAAVESAVDNVISRFGSINFLINNAGVSPRNSIIETSPEEFKRCLDVNV